MQSGQFFFLVVNNTILQVNDAMNAGAHLPGAMSEWVNDIQKYVQRAAP